MLSRAQRVQFVSLVSLLMITAIMEMAGMVVLFGFVRGLTPDPATGRRSGPLAGVLERVHGGGFGQLQFVLWAGAVVLGFMLVKNMQGTSVRFAISRFLMKLNQRISEQLYRSYMLAPYELFVKRGITGPAKEVSRIFNLFNTCFSATVQLLADGSMLVMVVLLLLYVDYRLTLLAAAIFSIVGVVLYRVLQKSLSEMGRLEADADQRTGQFLSEGLRGVIDVRLRGSRGYFFQSYSAALGRAAVLKRRAEAISRLPRSANELALGALIVGSTLYVTLRGETVAEALPTLGVFGFAGIRMNGVLTRVNNAAQKLRKKAEAFEKAYDQVSEISPASVGLPDTPGNDYLSGEKPLPSGASGTMQDGLRLEAVSFSYPDAPVPVLRDLSLTIKRGEFVAICGPSGGGKTTLLLLIMGIMRPTSGRIACDSWSVFDHVQAWHRNIGYVSQAMFMVDRSIRENVTFGINPKQVHDDRVWQALALASADEFVKQLPGGLDAKLTDGGKNLSGGQRQRLMIARALYENPEIVILDEATSALDNITEREVTDALALLSGQKTIICVAHRLSTIRGADRIYFLKDNELRASGTFSELLENCPEFAQMVAAGEVASPGSRKKSPRRKGRNMGLTT